MEPELIEITPLGVTRLVKLRVLEDKRPRSCPDPQGCKPLLTSLSLQENLDKGYSGQCYGYCGPNQGSFICREANHQNDISRCMFSPLKGVIRFFECYTDFMAEAGELTRMMHMLNPKECEECGECGVFAKLIIFSDRTLCTGCAVRTGRVQYHPENKGTGRAVYY